MTARRGEPGIRETAERLAELALPFCRDWLPEGRHSGAYWHCADTGGGQGRSLAVRLSGARAGRWIDYAEGTHGDLIDIIAEQRGIGLSDAMRDAREWLGWPTRPIVCRAPVETRGETTASPKDRAARKLWDRARPIHGTVVDRYLRARRVSVKTVCRTNVSTLLRFVAEAVLRKDGKVVCYCPTMLAAIRDGRGAFLGVHRTYLSPSAALARTEAPRRALGRMRTGAVWAESASGGVSHGADILVVGEGLETVLSVRTALPHLPVAAALSATNLRSFVPPVGLRTLWIAQDHDGPGEAAARFLQARLASEVPDLRVERLVPPRGDFNDMLRIAGPRRLARWLEDRMRARL